MAEVTLLDVAKGCQRSMYQCYCLQAQDSCFKDHMDQFVAVIVAQGC